MIFILAISSQGAVHSSQQPSREALHPHPHALLRGARLVLTDSNLRCGGFDAVPWFSHGVITLHVREDTLPCGSENYRISVRCIYLTVYVIRIH